MTCIIIEIHNSSNHNLLNQGLFSPQAQVKAFLLSSPQAQVKAFLGISILQIINNKNKVDGFCVCHKSQIDFSDW